MRHTHSQNLTDAQAVLLQERRKRLGLSRSALLQKFEAALQQEGCVHSLASAKMRLDRVLNPYLRRPATEATLTALAAALSWTLLELEAALGLQLLWTGENGHAEAMSEPRHFAKPPSLARANGRPGPHLSARETAFAILLLVQMIPAMRPGEVSANDLAFTYAAIERTWKRGARLLEILPTEKGDPALPVIKHSLRTILHGTLQPYLHKYPRMGAGGNGKAASPTPPSPQFIRELAKAVRTVHGEARKLYRLLLRG